MLKVGDKAPDFRLFSSEKKEISLSDYAGKKLIIQFFPQAFTGVCTEQLCEARDNMAIYQGLGAEVVGISVDSLFTLAKFKEDNAYTFPLLSDFNKTTSAAYDALYEDFVFGMKGVTKRAAFAIDGNGVIIYAEVLASAGDLPNFIALRAAL